MSQLYAYETCWKNLLSSTKLGGSLELYIPVDVTIRLLTKF